MLLTARRYYAIRGVRAGSRLRAAARHLRIRPRPLRVGANQWVMFRFGSAEGVLKVRRGVVQEVGIADRRFASTRRAQARLLRSF
jgi:hypothetical protein